MWYFVAATFDATSGEVALYQLPLEKWPHDDSRAAVAAHSDLRSVEQSELPLLIAARWGDNDKPAAFFNGKIDSPHVYSSALSKEEIEAFYRGNVPDGAVAAWDFSADISSTKISDVSGHRLHGTTVNLPTRAVTGYNWKGDEVDFRRVPEQYGAIHFHDDDLDDANWANI